jgi:hypothetical protein
MVGENCFYGRCGKFPTKLFDPVVALFLNLRGILELIKRDSLKTEIIGLSDNTTVF